MKKKFKKQKLYNYLKNNRKKLLDILLITKLIYYMPIA